MGVNNRALVRRLRAWNIGAPVARGTTIHTAVGDPDNRFILAFVRMGGESRPWAVAWKAGTEAVKIRHVGEPRAREFVDEMLVELAEDLASHLGHPFWGDVAPLQRGEVVEHSELRQVWVPNSSHIDMLHFLAYAYIRRRGDTEADASLRLLGRTALHLFLESRRPGQQIIIDASSAVRSAFDFPCEDSRQSHLGLLLAWLNHRGDRDKGIAAALEAERLPVSISLNPALERDTLVDLVEKYNESRDGRGRGDKAREKAIGDVLRPELERRVNLVIAAIEQIDNDERPYNDGLNELATTTYEELYWRYLRLELTAVENEEEPFAPSPETDWDARNAAERYFRNTAAQDRERNALIHYDHELEAEAINEGSAFRGIITHVEDRRVKRATIPVWTVVDSSPGPLSLRQWDTVCIVGAPKRKGVICDIEPLEDGSLQLSIEITFQKLEVEDAVWPHSMSAIDQTWTGLPVTIISDSFAELNEIKKRKVSGRSAAPADWMVAMLSRQSTSTEDGE